MKVIFTVLSLLLLNSCTLKKNFVQEQVCSPSAISYIRNSKGRAKHPPMSLGLRTKLAETQKGMQMCYNDYLKRTGHEEFQTCLVVGVDEVGRLEYYNFSSQDIHSDRGFIQCAVKVTKRVPYWKFGKNYIMVQTYNFY